MPAPNKFRPFSKRALWVRKSWGAEPPGTQPRPNVVVVVGRGRARERSEGCPHLGVLSAADFVRTTTRGSLGTFHPWKVPRPGAKYPPSFSENRGHGIGKGQTSGGAPGHRALRTADEMLRKLARWGIGPYEEPRTIHAVEADIIRPAFCLEIQPVVLQLVDQIPQQVHVIGGDDISRNGRPP